MQLSCLTPRQRKILQLAAGGASQQEIARALGIKPTTVKNHIAEMKLRYQVGTHTALVIEGIRRGDVDELLAYADVEGRRRIAE